MSPPAHSPGIPRSSTSARIRFPAPRQERDSTDPRRLPPTGSTVSYGSRRIWHCVDRHWCRWLLAKGPASNMRSRPNPWSARPNCLPAIRRGRKATCYLSASATDYSPSTPAPCPNPAWEAASRLLADGNVPFGSPPTELSQVRGHLACFTASTPTVRDRSLRWIYPNLTGSGTLCHETVPR